jgi:hypothetical protein
MKKDEDGPSNVLQIEAYMHCGMCLKELPSGESPESYARLSVGWTRRGLQVWCVRHEVNVLHVDFEGQKHKANTTRALRPGEKPKMEH